MLLPRPEIRIATRFGSRIVRRGPILGAPQVPAWPQTVQPRWPAFDPADLEDRFARAFERAVTASVACRRNDHRHADAAVEGPRHFFRGDPAALLQQREDRRQLPALRIDHGMAAIGQNPRNILEKSAAGDMRQALDPALAAPAAAATRT